MCVGQVLGIFLSPLFLQMFMSAPGWEFGQPVAEGGKSSTDGLKQIYKQVGQHMGLAIFLPMVIYQRNSQRAQADEADRRSDDSEVCWLCIARSQC